MINKFTFPLTILFILTINVSHALLPESPKLSWTPPTEYEPDSEGVKQPLNAATDLQGYNVYCSPFINAPMLPPDSITWEAAPGLFPDGDYDCHMKSVDKNSGIESVASNNVSFTIVQNQGPEIPKPPTGFQLAAIDTITPGVDIGTIGYDKPKANVSFVANRTYINAQPQYTYTAASDNEEIYQVQIWQGKNNTNTNYSIGIYDITQGINNATLVGSQNFIGTSDSNSWKIDTFNTPIKLTKDKKYQIAFRSDNTRWNGRVGLWDGQAEHFQENTTELPATFISDGTNATPMAVYGTVRETF